MYDYGHISPDLFYDMFNNNYDWNLFVDQEEFLPESQYIECETYHDYSKLDRVTWLLSKKEQKKLIDNQNIDIKRKNQYINGFPYISAIVPYVSNDNTMTSDQKHEFYPFKNK